MKNKHQKKPENRCFLFPAQTAAIFLAAALLLAALIPSSPVCAIDDVYTFLSEENIEEAVREIRSWYYNPGEWDTSYSVSPEDNGWEYEQEYYYHHGRLAFAFLFKGREEHRFYFLEDILIRVIDENGETWNYPGVEQFDDWETRILESAYMAYYGPDWFENPVFEGEDGWDGSDEYDWDGSDDDGQDDPMIFETEDETEEMRLRAVRYTGEDADFHFVLAEEPVTGSFFVIRLDETGESLEGPRMAWLQEEETWFFVGGTGEDHTYMSLAFAGDGSFLVFDEGDGNEKVFYADPYYEDNDLIALARLYYETHHGGESPEIIESESEEEESTVLLHLYEEVQDAPGSGHAATWDWYTVDRATLETEDILGNHFFLNILD